MFVSLTQVCVLYIVKVGGGEGWVCQLMGVACKRTCARATNHQEECKL